MAPPATGSVLLTGGQQLRVETGGSIDKVTAVGTNLLTLTGGSIGGASVLSAPAPTLDAALNVGGRAIFDTTIGTTITGGLPGSGQPSWYGARIATLGSDMTIGAAVTAAGSGLWVEEAGGNTITNLSTITSGSWAAATGTFSGIGIVTDGDASLVNRGTITGGSTRHSDDTIDGGIVASNRLSPSTSTTIANSGTITGAVGIFTVGNGSTLHLQMSSGRIEGNNVGVAAKGNVSLQGEGPAGTPLGGTIVGTLDDGLRISGSLLNDATLDATIGGNTRGLAIGDLNGRALTNRKTVQAAASAGTTGLDVAGGSGIIVNDGATARIAGGGDAIRVTASALTLDNSGTIAGSTSGSAGWGVNLTGTATSGDYTVRNRAGATIAGRQGISAGGSVNVAAPNQTSSYDPTTGIFTSSVTTRLENAGTLDGRLTSLAPLVLTGVGGGAMTGTVSGGIFAPTLAIDFVNAGTVVDGVTTDISITSPTTQGRIVNQGTMQTSINFGRTATDPVQLGLHGILENRAGATFAGSVAAPNGRLTVKNQGSFTGGAVTGYSTTEVTNQGATASMSGQIAIYPRDTPPASMAGYSPSFKFQNLDGARYSGFVVLENVVGPQVPSTAPWTAEIVNGVGSQMDVPYIYVNGSTTRLTLTNAGTLNGDVLFEGMPGATITNSGTLNGGIFSDNFFFAQSAATTLTNTGTITGGITLAGADDSITNSGSISGSVDLGAGVATYVLGQGATQGGTVSAGSSGGNLFRFDMATGSTRSFGAVGASGIIGITGFETIRQTGSGTVISNGTMDGSVSLIDVQGGTFRNGGAIGAGVGRQLLLDGDQTGFTNSAGATMSAPIVATAGTLRQSVFNDGTITGSITLLGGDDYVSNRGTITGTVDLGDGNDSFVWWITSANGTSGAIIAGNGVDSLLLGVDAGQSVTLTGPSSGAVPGGAPTGFEGIGKAGDGTLTWSFSDTLDTQGLRVLGGRLILNSAVNASLSAPGATDGSGYVHLDGPGSVLENNSTLFAADRFEMRADQTQLINTGTITVLTGGAGTITGDAGRQTIDNAGTINAAVNLGDGNDVYILRQSGTQVGAVNGGAGTDIFQFDVTTTRSFTGSEPVSFETVRKTGAGTLTLTGTLDAATTLVDVQGGTFANAGTTATTTTIGLSSGTTLDNSGTAGGAVQGTGAGATILNSGTITGAVTLIGAGNTYRLAATGEQVGVASGGSAAPGSANSLTIETAAAGRTLAAGRFLNFQQIALNADAASTGVLRLQGAAAPGVAASLDTGGGAGSSITLSRGGLSLFEAGSSLRAETVTFAAGTTLSGIGTIYNGVGAGIGAAGGATTVAGTIAPGNSPGTLTIDGNLALVAGTLLSYEFGQANTPGGTLNDLTVVTGNLTLDGSLTVTQSAGGIFTPGVYRIFTYNGVLTDNTLDILGALPNGLTGSIQTAVANQVNLVVLAAGAITQYWDGANTLANGTVDGGTDTWRAATTNWTVSTGASNSAWAGGLAVFQGTPGTVTVQGGFSPTFDGLQFNVGNYRLQGSTLRPNAGAFVTVTGAFDTTIDSVIEGGGSLSKQGVGRLILTGTNTYTGGTSVASGTLQLGNGGTSGSIVGDVALSAGATLAFDRSDTVTFGGIVSGDGGLGQVGPGTTILTGTNTYTGGTTVSAGTLQVGNGGTTGSIVGNVATAAGATLAFNRSDTVTFGGVVSGGGSLAQIGGGTTILTGDNTYTGATTVSAGTLQVGNGGTAGSIVGNVATSTGATLALNRSDTVTFGGDVSGGGSLAQIGAGTTILTGSSTYTGGTTIAAGTLQLGNGGTTGSIVGNVTTAAGATLAFNRADTVTFTGVVSGGGALNQAGAGTTVLTGANSHTGGTTVSAGTLQLGNGGTAGSIAGDVATAAGATLAFNRADAVTFGGVVSGGGALSQAGPGTTVLTAANSYTGGTTVSAGTLQLGNGGTTGSIADDVVTAAGATLAFNRADTVTFAGVVSGAGALAQAGPGTTVLTGDSTYTGGTTISAGTLQLGNGGTTGSVVGDVVTATGTTLAIDRADAVVLGGIVSGGGALRQAGTGTTVLTGDSTYSGGTTIAAGTLQLGTGGTSGWVRGDIVDNGALAINRSDTVTLGGVVSGTGGLAQRGSGSTILTGANTYGGGTTVSAGTLQLGNGGTSGSILGNVATATGAMLAFNRADTVTFAGVVSGGGALVQAGPGTTVLTANNTYGGGTTVSAGTLQLGNGGTSGAIAGNVVTAPGATLAFNRADTVTFGGVVSGGGALAQVGPGTTVLTGTSTHGGGTTIAAGILQLGNGGASGAVTGNVANDGTLAFNRADAQLFGGIVSGGGAVVQAGTGTTVLTGNSTYTGGTSIASGTLQLGNGGTSGSVRGDIVDNGILAFNRSDTVTFGGVVSGNGGLVQRGTGTTILTGANTYGGGTAVAAGTLQLGNGGASGSITGDVATTTGATLAFNRADTVTFGGVVSGGGALAQAGPGTTVLASNNTYTGGTTVSAGTLQLGNGGTSGWIAGNVATVAGATLAFNRADTMVFAGAVSGGGAVLQAGAGTTVLTGNHGYAGGTTIAVGTLQLGNGGAAGWVTGNIVDNGTLAFNRSDVVTFGASISGTGGLVQKGPGSLDLAGANTYIGPTQVQAGTLLVNGSITSDTTVFLPGTLGGNGTIVGRVVNNGTVAPGNSIGQLNIVGSYTQAAGSTYQVELNPAGQSDRIVVTGAPGTASILGGTVAVQAANGVYPTTYRYTILSATGVVTGRYSGLTTNLAFLRPSITYDANNVYLVANPAYAPGSKTQNQMAVACALDQAVASASGDFNTMLGALLGLDTAQGPAALDTISGQPYSGLGTANLFGGALFANAVRQQMALGRAGANDGSRAPIVTADGTVSRLSSWATAIGGTGTVLGGGSGIMAPSCGAAPAQAAQQTYSTGGTAAGLDYQLDPSARLGLAIGYASTTTWTTGFNSRGTTDSYLLATYADFTSGAAYAAVMAGYAWNANQMTRQMTIPGLGSRTASASTGAPQWFGQAEAGYRFSLDDTSRSAVTPFARIEASTVSQAGFTEWGANGLNLAVAGQATSSLRTVLGAEFSAAWNLGWQAPLGLQVRIGWAHDYADMTRPVTAAFAAAPGYGFTIYGASPPRDSATVGIGLSTVVDDRYTLFLRYDGDVSGGASSHAVNAGIRFRW